MLIVAGREGRQMSITLRLNLEQESKMIYVYLGRKETSAKNETSSCRETKKVLVIKSTVKLLWKIASLSQNLHTKKKLQSIKSLAQWEALLPRNRRSSCLARIEARLWPLPFHYACYRRKWRHLNQLKMVKWCHTELCFLVKVLNSSGCMVADIKITSGSKQKYASSEAVQEWGSKSFCLEYDKIADWPWGVGTSTSGVWSSARRVPCLLPAHEPHGEGNSKHDRKKLTRQGLINDNVAKLGELLRVCKKPSKYVAWSPASKSTAVKIKSNGLNFRVCLT